MKHLLLLTVFLAGCNHCGIGEAKNSAKDFASKHYPNHVSVDCVGGSTPDSDDDGYASCTIFLEDSTIPIECATENDLFASKGCRVATGH